MSRLYQTNVIVTSASNLFILTETSDRLADTRMIWIFEA